MAETPDKATAAPAAHEPTFASDWQRREYRDKQDSLRLERTEANNGEFASDERIIASTIGRLSPEEKKRYQSGALADGTSFRLDPETRRALVDASLATVPAALAEAAKRHGGNQKTAIEEMMRNRSGPYWKGPDSELLQRTYRECIRSAAQAPTNASNASAPARSAAPAKAAGSVSIDQVDMGRVFAYAREHRSDPKAYEKGIAELTGAGVSPKDAKAVADYVRSQLR